MKVFVLVYWSNGMTYYIKSNQEPKERASFYIIQNVGALAGRG